MYNAVLWDEFRFTRFRRWLRELESDFLASALWIFPTRKVAAPWKFIAPFLIMKKCTGIHMIEYSSPYDDLNRSQASSINPTALFVKNSRTNSWQNTVQLEQLIRVDKKESFRRYPERLVLCYVFAQTPSLSLVQDQLKNHLSVWSCWSKHSWSWKLIVPARSIIFRHVMEFSCSLWSWIIKSWSHQSFYTYLIIGIRYLTSDEHLWVITILSSFRWCIPTAPRFYNQWYRLEAINNNNSTLEERRTLFCETGWSSHVWYQVVYSL